jgi:hypothetical protein
MYKINQTDRFKNFNSNSNKNDEDNENDNKYGKYGSKYDLIHQDIQKMHLLPPHCPMYPMGYNVFYNDSKELKPMTPYKMKDAKNARDGKFYKKLEYNNFYSDWKQDALKWYPNSLTTINNRASNEYDTIPVKDNINNINSPNIYNNESTRLYEETRRQNNFANPLVTNGTNQLNILFNNKCTEPTFNYKRYAAKNVNNVDRYENPLYDEDISNETQGLISKYMTDILQNNMNLYSSVAEDMYALSYDPTIANNTANNTTNNTANNNLGKYTYDVDAEVNSNIYSNAVNSIRRSY